MALAPDLKVRRYMYNIDVYINLRQCWFPTVARRNSCIVLIFITLGGPTRCGTLCGILRLESVSLLDRTSSLRGRPRITTIIVIIIRATLSWIRCIRLGVFRFIPFPVKSTIVTCPKCSCDSCILNGFHLKHFWYFTVTFHHHYGIRWKIVRWTISNHWGWSTVGWNW